MATKAEQAQRTSDLFRGASQEALGLYALAVAEEAEAAAQLSGTLNDAAETASRQFEEQTSGFGLKPNMDSELLLSRLGGVFKQIEDDAHNEQFNGRVSQMAGSLLGRGKPATPQATAETAYKI